MGPEYYNISIIWSLSPTMSGNPAVEEQRGDQQSREMDADRSKESTDIHENDPQGAPETGEGPLPEEESWTAVDPSVVEKLSIGLLEICLPSLQKSKSSLDDLLQNQQFLTESVQQENSKFADCRDIEELSKTMNQARKYHTKLINLKKEMNFLSDKGVKLKRRALKIQQQKQKEDLQRVQQRMREQEREKMLEAKVVKRSQSPT